MSKLITGRIGLIGNPVAHSLSPVFQQVALDAHDIPVQYELWQTETDDVSARLDQIRSGEIFGANVTVPHKEVVFRSVGKLSDIARQVGAVNTLLMQGELLYGDNTDVYGFLCGLESVNFRATGKTALIIGAGGAARAVAVGLLHAGIDRLVISNRTLKRAETLAADLESERVRTIPLSAAVDEAATTNLVINATSLGWNDDLPVSREFFNELPAEALAYDLTYRTTPFIQAAQRSGISTLDGLPMLVYQGSRSFEIWTDFDAPIQIMMDAAIQARNNRQ